MAKHRVALAVFSFATFLLAGGDAVMAQGVYVSAGGATHRGMGGASTAAPVSALGALYWNPATISGLERSETEVGLDLLFVNHTAASSIGGLSGTTEADPGVFPIPNVGLVYHTENPAITLGLGINAVAGFKTNLPADPNNPVLNQAAGGLGRVSSEATFLQAAPVVSLAVSERLSIAAGPLITMGQLGLEPFVFAPPNPDGAYSPARATRYHWGGGVQAGAYYIHDEDWRFGASIKSPIWMERLEYVGQDENGGPRTLHAELDLPLIVSLGTAYSGWEDRLLAVDLRYFDYAGARGFGDSPNFNGTGTLDGLGWRSIFALSLGGQQRVSDNLYLRLGYTFNESPIRSGDTFVNIGSPLIYRHMISTGLSYQLNSRMALSAAYSYLVDDRSSGPVVLPGIGPVPGSSFRTDLDAHILSGGFIMRL